jgi:hypothetical protein
MRSDRIAAAWPFVTALPLLAPLALLPFVMVHQFGCGEFTPPGQDENIESFRAIALPLIGLELVVVAAAIVFLTWWSRPPSGSRRFVPLGVAAALLALVLATPFRGWIAFGGLTAFAMWPITVGSALVLVVVLATFRSRISTPTGRATASLTARGAAWLVGLVLLGLLLVASEWDGGPFYC